MTLSSPACRAREFPQRALTKRAFTLAEVLISLLVFTLISGAVFGSFLFFSKSGISVGKYVEIDQQARVALEKFAYDVRTAIQVNWTSSTQLELTVPLGEFDSDGNYRVTYRYLDGSFGTASLRETFARQVTYSGNTTLMPVDAEFVPLLKGVSRLTFRRYNVGTPTEPLDPDDPLKVKTAGSNSDTKQINLDLVAYRTRDSEKEVSDRPRATNVVLSSRYILRNKFVAN